MTADIAAVAAGRLLAPSWTGRQVLGVHGPKALSLRQVAQRLTTALGHTVEAQQLTDDDVRSRLAGFGLPEAQVNAIVMVTVGIRDDLTPENPRSYVTTTPHHDQRVGGGTSRLTATGTRDLATGGTLPRSHGLESLHDEHTRRTGQ